MELMYQPSPLEEAYGIFLLESVFRVDDQDPNFCISGRVAVPFLSKACNLERQVLRHIWNVVDPDSRGKLVNAMQFHVILRLIALGQMGILSIQQLMHTESPDDTLRQCLIQTTNRTDVPLAIFEGCSIPNQDSLQAHFSQKKCTPNTALAAFDRTTVSNNMSAVGTPDIALDGAQLDRKTDSFYTSKVAPNCMEVPPDVSNGGFRRNSVVPTSIEEAYEGLVNVPDVPLPMVYSETSTTMQSTCFKSTDQEPQSTISSFERDTTTLNYGLPTTPYTEFVTVSSDVTTAAAAAASSSSLLSQSLSRAVSYGDETGTTMSGDIHANSMGPTSFVSDSRTSTRNTNTVGSLSMPQSDPYCSTPTLTSVVADPFASVLGSTDATTLVSTRITEPNTITASLNTATTHKIEFSMERMDIVVAEQLTVSQNDDENDDFCDFEAATPVTTMPTVVEGDWGALDALATVVDTPLPSLLTSLPESNSTTNWMVDTEKYNANNIDIGAPDTLNGGIKFGPLASVNDQCTSDLKADALESTETTDDGFGDFEGITQLAIRSEEREGAVKAVSDETGWNNFSDIPAQSTNVRESNDNEPCFNEFQQDRKSRTEVNVDKNVDGFAESDPALTSMGHENGFDAFDALINDEQSTLPIAYLGKLSESCEEPLTLPEHTADKGFDFSNAANQVEVAKTNSWDAFDALSNVQDLPLPQLSYEETTPSEEIGQFSLETSIVGDNLTGLAGAKFISQPMVDASCTVEQEVEPSADNDEDCFGDFVGMDEDCPISMENQAQRVSSEDVSQLGICNFGLIDSDFQSVDTSGVDVVDSTATTGKHCTPTAGNDWNAFDALAGGTGNAPLPSLESLSFEQTDKIEKNGIAPNDEPSDSFGDFLEVESAALNVVDPINCSLFDSVAPAEDQQVPDLGTPLKMERMDTAYYSADLKSSASSAGSDDFLDFEDAIQNSGESNASSAVQLPTVPKDTSSVDLFLTVDSAVKTQDKHAVMNEQSDTLTKGSEDFSVFKAASATNLDSIVSVDSALEENLNDSFGDFQNVHSLDAFNSDTFVSNQGESFVKQIDNSESANAAVVDAITHDEDYVALDAHSSTQVAKSAPTLSDGGTHDDEWDDFQGPVSTNTIEEIDEFDFDTEQEIRRSLKVPQIQAQKPVAVSEASINSSSISQSDTLESDQGKHDICGAPDLVDADVVDDKDHFEAFASFDAFESIPETECTTSKVAGEDDSNNWDDFQGPINVKATDNNETAVQLKERVVAKALTIPQTLLSRNNGEIVNFEECFEANIGLESQMTNETKLRVIRSIRLMDLLAYDHSKLASSYWAQCLIMIREELSNSLLLMREAKGFSRKDQDCARAALQVYQDGLCEYVRVTRYIIATLGDLLMLENSALLTIDTLSSSWCSLSLASEAIEIEKLWKSVEEVGSDLGLNKKNSTCNLLNTLMDIRSLGVHNDAQSSFDHFTLQTLSLEQAMCTQSTVKWEGKPFMACTANLLANKCAFYDVNL